MADLAYCRHCGDIFGPSEYVEVTVGDGTRPVYRHRCPDGHIEDRFSAPPKELLELQEARLEAVLKDMLRIEEETSEESTEPKSWFRRLFRR